MCSKPCNLPRPRKVASTILPSTSPEATQKRILPGLVSSIVRCRLMMLSYETKSWKGGLSASRFLDHVRKVAHLTVDDAFRHVHWTISPLPKFKRGADGVGSSGILDRMDLRRVDGQRIRSIRRIQRRAKVLNPKEVRLAWESKSRERNQLSITGCRHNDAAMPPYKTRMVWLQAAELSHTRRSCREIPLRIIVHLSQVLGDALGSSTEGSRTTDSRSLSTLCSKAVSPVVLSRLLLACASCLARRSVPICLANLASKSLADSKLLLIP